MPEQGVTGKTPVLETGETTTLDPGQNATSEVVSNGTDESGNPKYKINFGIPRGADGTGEGGGGVSGSVQWSSVLNKPTWVNSATKPSYTAAEVGALPASTTIPSRTSQLTNDSKFVASDGLKTINGQSIVGSGNIEITGSGSGIADAPSDGKTYGRKDGNWATIESVGGSVDITDIMLRLTELAGVGGTCTDDDYNALKGYAENGVITYINDGTSYGIIYIQYLSGKIIIKSESFEDKRNIIAVISISADKLVSTTSSYFLSVTIMGDGCLGTYTKPSAYSAITESDSISEAIGKLEAGISNGSSSDFYYVPSAVLTLSSSATSDEILAAFGGSGKRTELANAVKEGKIIVIEGTGGLYGSAIVPHCYTLGGILVYLSFIRNRAGTSENVRIVLGSSPSITVIYANGFKLSSKINVLKSSSTSEEISSAIGGLEGILALKKAIEDGNTIYADADNSVIGANEISGRMQLSVIISKNSTGYNISISGIQSESYFAFFSAAYLIISYYTESNTFSCNKYGFNVSETE